MQKGQVAYVLITILVSMLGFGLGRLSKIEDTRPALVVEDVPPAPMPQGARDPNIPDLGLGGGEVRGASAGKYVASKSGTKFHYPWCSGAARIKKENEVWFESKEAALAAGYVPAANCPGL
jgi:hypothetical protein